MVDVNHKNESERNRYLEKIIASGDAQTLVEIAQSISSELVQNKAENSVSTSQIRNIYGSCKKIEMKLNINNINESFKSLYLLIPKLEYANGRFNTKDRSGKDKIPGFRILVDWLSDAIKKAGSDMTKMNNFFNFFEAILAYHKAKGGK